MENTSKSDQNFEREREEIETRHRNEILNLLKSFEFERKDMEARFQEELEKKDSEMRSVQSSEFEKNDMEAKIEEELETKDSEMGNVQENDIDKEGSFSNEEKNGLRVKFEKEKEELIIKIAQLEDELKKKGTEESLSAHNQGHDGLKSEKVNQSQDTFDEMRNSKSSTSEMKSLSELETENRKLQADLMKSRDEIFELKSHVKDLTQKLQDIEKLFQDGDISSDKKDILSQILQGTTADISSHDGVKSSSSSPETRETSFEEMDTSVSANKLHRTNSVLSFQLEELNLENEDLKRSVHELEQKLRKTVEENETKINVFNEKLNELVEKIVTSSETTEESGFKMNLVEEISNARLEKTPSEFLEEYVSIVLRQKLTAPSPDIVDVNFCHELQSLEQILDIEIFYGRVFDSEMKDEVKQVLRDKERELLVAYTLEKLRDEIRHRATTEGTLEELQKERERDFCVHEAVNEVLKEHLGILGDKEGQTEGESRAANGVAKVHLGASGDGNELANKVLREHLGIIDEDDKVVHSSSLEDNEVGRIQNQSSSIDVESLKAEKENLERNLQELQEYFEKERQAWLEKLQSSLQGSNDSEEKDKLIQSVQAQKALTEEILNMERFHLSRLYYMEMKEELETCLKEHQFDRNMRRDKERFVDAWKHHAEVGELYQEILSKETENLQSLQTTLNGENTPTNDTDLQNVSPSDDISKEHSRLEQQLPVKLELLELQRRRCRDHKAASLILEQAVVALETAAQEQDTLLVGGDYLRRKSSWSSNGEETESPDVRKEVSPQDETGNKDVSSLNTSTELMRNRSRKDGLVDALVTIFERLLNGQQESNDPQMDSCASDSEFSEVETLSGRDIPSDDEGSTKNLDSVNLEDASSTHSSPRPTEPNTEHPEDHLETDDNTSDPVVFKLPPRIENILNIERFNMSRLLRDEYIDKIRRGREKLRRARAKKQQQNGELVSKFQDEVKVLLEDVEFGESVGEEKIPPRQRQKLTATPSYDSGIVDPMEQEKEDVVRKYKQLLEKARRDLNRAHRALKARNSGGKEIMDEIAAMKKSTKEAKNDLDELEEKRSDLDHEREDLLRKIKDAQNSASVNDEQEMSKQPEVSELKKDDEMPLQSDVHSGKRAQSVTPNTDEEGMEPKGEHSRVGGENANQASISDNYAEGGKRGSFERATTETVREDMERHIEELENKIKKLCEEKMAAEEEVRELQRKLVAGSGGEDILNDLQEKLTDVNEQKSRLEEKCSELERDKLEKDKKFETAMKEKEQEISELRNNLVAGTGCENILKELQGNLQKAEEAKLEVEERCSGLEKAIKEKEEKLRKSEEEMEVLERKSVEGTDAEEIVEKLQGKLNETKAENATAEERCRELENEIEKKNKEIISVKEHQEQDVEELQRKLLVGTGDEDILKDLQEKLRETKEQNRSVVQNNSDLQKEIERKEKVFSDEKKKMEAEINDLQTKLVAGTGGEEILKDLQEKKQEADKQKCSLEERNVELEKEIERKDKEMKNEINELQRKLMAGAGGEEILQNIQAKLQEAKEQKSSLEERNSELQKEIERNEEASTDEKKMMREEINDLQRKLVAGTGGEEVLKDLQEKLQEAKEKNSSSERRNSELQDRLKQNEKTFSSKERKMEDEINDLQRKLVAGTGGEELLVELQDKLENARQEKNALQTKCEEFEDKAKAKDEEFSKETKKKDSEISDLQKKLVSGTGGEEILAEFQDKLGREKEENAALQAKCDKLEDTVKTRNKEYIGEIKEKDNEISDLQKKLVSGTGGEEIFAELQDKLEREKEENAALQAKCKDLEDRMKAKDEEFSREIKEKDSEISDLQKKLVNGTGGEEIFAELQDKLERKKEEKTALQTKCENLEYNAKEKDKQFGKEIEERDTKINELQKKLVAGTGGEEILAELQDKLENAKKEKDALKTECQEFEDKAKANDKEFREEIREKDDEICNLQKQLVRGTGGEEILAELQDKLERSKEEINSLKTKCEDLQDNAKAKDKEFDKEIKEKDNEINALQKKLVSGTGGEEILSKLQDELKELKNKNAVLQAQCLRDENKATEREKGLEDEIKKKEYEIQNLQTQLVSGTGCEEMLNELQDKLEITKEENARLKEECSQLEENLIVKDKELNGKIQQKDAEIFELQRKLVSGSGGEEVLLDLQNKLKDTGEERGELAERCLELEREVKLKDKELFNQKRKNAEEVNDLQKKLIAGTGSEDVLQELQNKLKETEMEKEIMAEKCKKLKGKIEKKDMEGKEEKAKSDEEVNKLQKKLISGTGGEEVLQELQGKLKEVEMEKALLKEKCSKLEDEIKKKDIEAKKEMTEREEEVNKLQKKVLSGSGGEEILEELQKKLKAAEKKKQNLERTCAGLEGEIEKKDKQLQRKDKEVDDLQKNIVVGTGGEDLLEELQEKLRDSKDSEKSLEKRCSGLEKELQEKDDGNKNKQNEIEDLQRKLLSGTGGEEVLFDLQEKLNEANQEKAVLESKLAELETDSEEMDAKFASQLNNKQEEINKLQRDLVEGSEAEEVVADLQEKLAVAKEETKKFDAKCRELEKFKRQNNLDRDDGKELTRLQAANKVLENENEAKQDKINELQFKMIQGTGGEDVLKDLQNDLSEANEKNKELEIRIAELEHDGDDSGEYGEENIVAVLKEENERLKANNDKIVEKLKTLQKSVVNGTGSEELLQELQNEIKELSSENNELRKEMREKEATGRRGKDVKQLEKDLNKADLERKRLISDNESKDEEIAGLQRKLVAGSGGEDLLENLQQKIKVLEDANKNMARQCDDVEDMKKDMIDEKQKNKKLEKELLISEMENGKLAEENEAKNKDILKLQRLMVDGSGSEKLLKALQDKISESTENNIVLEKKCFNLEIDTVRLAEDTELLQQRLAEADNEIERLGQDCEEKDREIVELQRKLVEGTGCEEILKNLQNQVKNLQEKNKDLEKKLAKTKKDIALEGLKKKDKYRKRELELPNRHRETDEGKPIMGKLKNSSGDHGNFYQDKNEEFGETEVIADEDINELPTYEECLQVIPEIKEEKDYWQEKYKTLRMKVGGQFVDTIPDVWCEETLLEKEREDILSQLLNVRQEIADKETPVVKTVCKQERIETELSRVEDDLEACNENLEQLRYMENERKLIGKNEQKLMECLHELGINDDLLQGSNNKDENSNEGPMIQDGIDIEVLERKLELLYNEVEELLTEEQNFKDRENDNGLVDEKINTENEIKEINAAIENLQKDLSTQNDLYCSNLEGEINPHSEGINNELEKIQQEINLLQFSFETPSSSSGQEVNNLVDLVKEKSKLEDELTDTEKSLNQLGKREYETLVRERETHEKVAKKLLELSREKEVIEGELQELEALAQEKESKLQQSFDTELKSNEGSDTSSKKRRGFRKRKSGYEVKSDDPVSVSSAEEGFSEIDLGEPPLNSEITLALSEELGSLIQKKSSLEVRLEKLNKEITAQSLKVEKSLLGVKDDPGAGPSLGTGYASVEDLTQSQISLFDDYNMVDELSLATNIVREERGKRKSSRKAPMSKLLKEKSALEKKLRETQGKVLVQNAKVKNALKEEKDARKAKEKFVQAVQDRKAVENDFANVCSKIDELASDEGSVKEKKAKTLKGRKSLSKNDKRRLLSQRESLGKQLDTIKKKIENFSLDGEDAGLADFPEMREVGNIGNTVERLRELLAREAELKQELDRLTSKELSESSGSGMISDSVDSYSSDEGLLDSGGELGKRDDKNGHMKNVGETSDSGTLSESSDNKGVLKEMFRDVGKQVKRFSISKEKHEVEATAPTTQIEDNINANIDYGESSSQEKGAQSRPNTFVLQQTPYSKDTVLSSQKDGKMVSDRSVPYPEVMEVLLKEKARKEAKLSGLENEIEDEKSVGKKIKDSTLASQRKREDLKNKLKLALNEMEQRKEALDESKTRLENLSKGSSDTPEQSLEESRVALTQEKENLEADLVAVKNELDRQSQSGEGLDGISSDYQSYKDIKRKENDLVAALDKVNDKLHKRKEWSAVDNPEEENKTNLAETYADILKRMTEENLNMADLIHELEETKETLSKEREITSELLDLIKSRVGNELLEALMGEGLQSPSVEIREMGMFGGEEYPELFDEAENDTVTVAAIIDDYKRVNQFLFKENQKLHEKIEVVKVKVDEDLFASIVDQDSIADVEMSKKREISKILENNKTLFEQVVSNVERQNESLRMELEAVEKAAQKKKENDLNKMKEKLEDIFIKLHEAKNRREGLLHELKHLENDMNCSNEIGEEEHGHSTVIVDSSLNGSDESQNQTDSTDKSIENKVELTELGVAKKDIGSSSDRLSEIQDIELSKEEDELKRNDKDKILQEVRSSLEEVKELGNRVDIELEKLSKELVAIETPQGDGNTVKQSDGLESELNKEYENEDFGGGDGREYNEDDRRYRKDKGGYSVDDEDDKEDNDRLSEKMDCVENLKKSFVAKLDEVEKLQEKLKRNVEDCIRDEIKKQNKSLKDKLANLEIENEELTSKLQNIEAVNEELRNNLETGEETCDENAELKAKTQSLEKEKEETIAKFNETRKERDKILDEFENLQKEKKNIEKHLGSCEEDNKFLQEKIGTLENENKELNEVILALKNENEEGIVKLNEINETLKENEEKLESLKDLEEENESRKERLAYLEDENKKLKDKIQENESIKETLALLENENNEIIPKMEESQKLNKELEDEIEYLRKEEKDFESLNEKLKANEFARENIKEELADLRKDMKEMEDFVSENLKQDIGDGVITALEKYKKSYEQNEKQNNFLKADVEKMKNIQNIVGDNLSEKLLEFMKEGMILNDTQEIPKCVERFVKDKNTLASVLNEYENDLDKVKQHLGEGLFSLVVGKHDGLDGEDNEQTLKMAEELKCGRHIEDVVKEYEDLINSQASDRETVTLLQEKVDELGQELEGLRKQRDSVLVEEDDRGKKSVGDDSGNQNELHVKNGAVDGRGNSGESVKFSEAELVAATKGEDKMLKSSQEFQSDSLMNIEYEDLLKKVMDHQAEIEEAEQLLHEQRAKHEEDKQKMIEQVNAEKSNMQQLINSERTSMEKAMQNLINEIVRLKEERNEIRKNNRIEKEKLVLDFENERTEFISRYEGKKNETEANLEKTFQDDLEKVRREMETRESELKEELVKLKTERNDLASKVAEMEDKIGNEITEIGENEKLWVLNEKESKEQMRNEFEEKMDVEKKRFQETLNSLRQEIEKLQKERSKAMDDISTKQEDRLKQSTDFSANEAVIYDRLEFEFRTKMNSEKMLMESRIKELRKENEMLNHQKQELKSSMRMERLEISKKYEREKEELAEKYRNELKTLRKNLEKTPSSNDVSTSASTQNFYELRRKIRDRDTKLKRYETFFKELNQEASILQRDADMAV